MRSPERKRRKIETTVPEDESPVLLCHPVRVGAREDASNLERGILGLPVELRMEILDKFVKIDLFTEAFKLPASRHYIFPPKYFVRTVALRALSQVCVAYKREFLLFLWESLNLVSGLSCSTNATIPLKRICDGLLDNPHLSSSVKVVHATLIMHTAIESVPRFRMLLQSLQNLHTIHLAHSDHQIGKLLRQDGVMLPGIRTLVIQGHCYNLLRCCPNVTTVWCIEGDGTKLVPNMRQYCKKVEELRGFGGDGTILVGQYKSRKAKNPVKALISAVPHLRVFEVWDTNYSLFHEHISEFKELNTIIIKTSSTYVDPSSDVQTCTQDFRRRFNKFKASDTDQKVLLQKCIKTFKARFTSMPPCAGRRRIRLLHALSHGRDGDRCSGKYLEVDLD